MESRSKALLQETTLYLMSSQDTTMMLDSRSQAEHIAILSSMYAATETVTYILSEAMLTDLLQSLVQAQEIHFIAAMHGTIQMMVGILMISQEI
jgi:hypothetical protein